MQKAVFAFDNNLATSYQSPSRICFEVKPGVKAYILLLNNIQNSVKCVQLNEMGEVLAEKKLQSAFEKIEVAKGVTLVKLEGKIEIFDIVPVLK